MTNRFANRSANTPPLDLHERIPNRSAGSWLVGDKRKESRADAIGVEFELCWSRVKHKRRVLRHDWFGFLSRSNGADARHRVHPTQKTVSLMIDILQQWGGEAIADVYCGSGTTIIAAEELGRRCDVEVDPSYCQVIIDRWEAFTGEKAIKVGDGKKTKTERPASSRRKTRTSATQRQRAKRSRRTSSLSRSH